jgi:hypothetical protein
MLFQVKSFWIFLILNAALIQGFSFHSVPVFRLAKQPQLSQPKWIHKTNRPPHRLSMREAVCFQSNTSLEVVVPDLHSDSILKLKNLFLLKQIMNELQKMDSVSLSKLDLITKLLQDNKIHGFPDNDQAKQELLQRISDIQRTVNSEGQLIQQQTNISKEISPNVSSKQNLLNFFKNQKSTLVSLGKKAKEIKWKELVKQVSSIIWNRPADPDINCTAAFDLNSDQRSNKTMKMIFDWFVDSSAKELKQSLLIRKTLVDSLSTFSPSSPLIKYPDSLLQHAVQHKTGLSVNNNNSINRENLVHTLLTKLDLNIQTISKQILAFRLRGEMETIFQEIMSQLQNTSDPMDLKTIISEFIFLHQTLASLIDPSVHMISSTPSSSSTTSRLVSFLCKEADFFSGDEFDQKINETAIAQDCADFFSSSTQTRSTSLNESLSSSTSPSLSSSATDIFSLINENELINLYHQVRRKYNILFLLISFFLFL